jgi:hypothetical protein
MLPRSNSSRSLKKQEPLLKELRIRLQLPRMRHYEQGLPMKVLQAMPQHRAVYFFQDVVPNLDDKVRTYAKDVPVKRRMMDLAQRKSIGDPWLPLGMSIRENV